MLLDESALPHDLLVDSVLSYLDLYSLIKFSGTSKSCQKIVYNDIPKERFATISLSSNQNITDDQLHAFLDNINADNILDFIKKSTESREYSKFIFSKTLSEILKIIKKYWFLQIQLLLKQII